MSIDATHLKIQAMRLSIIVIVALTITGCGGKTPACGDPAALSEVIEYAKDAISERLLQNDPHMHTGQLMSKTMMVLTEVITTNYDEGIDKYSCSANLRVTLPPGIAALKNHRVFQSHALAQLKIDTQGNDIVSTVSYTTYRSEKENHFIVHAENENAPAKYIQIAHKIGAFDSELRALPDLRLGLTLYSTHDKSILIEPVDNGSLKFRVDYRRSVCRSWMQTITHERGDTLIYDNRDVGCSVTFSRLGAIMLVEHEGCELMAGSCYPDGIYQKQ